MKPTKSQEMLIQIAGERNESGKLSIDLVRIMRDHSGLSTGLREVRKIPCTGGVPRNVVVCGVSAWDAVMSLVHMAGEGTHGAGYVDTFLRTLKRLTSGGREQITIWLQEAREMPVQDRVKLVRRLSCAVEQGNYAVRVVFLNGRVKVRDRISKRESQKFLESEWLEERARIFEFSPEGLAPAKPLFELAETEERAVRAG